MIHLILHVPLFQAMYLGVNLRIIIIYTPSHHNIHPPGVSHHSRKRLLRGQVRFNLLRRVFSTLLLYPTLMYAPGDMSKFHLNEEFP